MRFNPRKSPRSGSKVYMDTAGVKQMIVGLGNPGEQYAKTRHNAGFIALDYIAEQTGTKLKKIKFKSLCGEAKINGVGTLLVKPQTFMNLSGETVQEAMAYYKLRPEQVIILLDDVNLDVGVIRLRRKGSDGGQNGMKNIIYLTGSDQFPRIKIGVGKRTHPNMDLADWVLSRFTPGEMETLDERLPDIYDACQLIFAGKMDQAMNIYTG